MKKTALVTGASSGIGLRLVHMLISDGYEVVATDINESALPKSASLARKLDVTRSEDWQQVLDETLAKFGRLDLLLNVAGYLRPGWAHEQDPVEVHRHFDINVKGVVFGTQVAARHMVRQREGHIINIASVAGLMPVPGLALYSASKYAVRGFSLAMAQELKEQGVAVTVVCPDAVKTPMLDLQKEHEQSVLTFSAPRVLTVDDIANVIQKRVIPAKPLEAWIPVSRGWLARLADVFPELTAWALPFLRWQGRKKQQRYVPDRQQQR